MHPPPTSPRTSRLPPAPLRRAWKTRRRTRSGATSRPTSGRVPVPGHVYATSEAARRSDFSNSKGSPLLSGQIETSHSFVTGTNGKFPRASRLVSEAYSPCQRNSVMRSARSKRTSSKIRQSVNWPSQSPECDVQTPLVNDEGNGRCSNRTVGVGSALTPPVKASSHQPATAAIPTGPHRRITRDSSCLVRPFVLAERFRQAPLVFLSRWFQGIGASEWGWRCGGIIHFHVCCCLVVGWAVRAID